MNLWLTYGLDPAVSREMATPVYSLFEGRVAPVCVDQVWQPSLDCDRVEHLSADWIERWGRLPWPMDLGCCVPLRGVEFLLREKVNG